MKSPKQLRTEIQTLRSGVEKIREVLHQKALDTTEPTWGIGRDCSKTAEALQEILRTQVLPEHYKVAVVGRSFLLEIIGQHFRKVIAIVGNRE